MPNQKAYFGAGCFWHVQADFDTLEGVVATAVGYMGGSTEKPTYEDYAGAGHIEVTQVAYDPSRVSYKRLLQAFWKMHDPTQIDRQGLDIGPQYRTVIFYQIPEQKKEAEESKRETEKKLGRPVATTIEKAQKFWTAEDYHQKYNAKHGIKGRVC